MYDHALLSFKRAYKRERNDFVKNFPIFSEGYFRMDEYNKRDRGSYRAENARRSAPAGRAAVPKERYDRPKAEYSDYGAAYESGEGKRSEYCYEPPVRNNSGKKGFNAALVVLCLCAIAISSIVGVSLLKDNIGEGDSGIERSPVTDSDVSGLTSSIAQPAAEQTQSSAADVITDTSSKELPTIISQASPPDAMTIPDIVKEVSPSVVGISCMVGNTPVSGTGIVMSSDGYIITNAHVVAGASVISVVFTDQTADSAPDKDDSSKSIADKILEQQGDEDNAAVISAERIGIDEQTDLAVLKVDRKGLTEAKFGSSGDVQVGELAIVIGNPLGFELANTVTSGIISATNRHLTIKDRTMNLIQTDASINSGNSGGPLINAYGRVIGITSAKVNPDYNVEGVGFAIPIDEAKIVIDDLIHYGYVKGRPTLGIEGKNIDAVNAQYYNIPQGFIVTKIEAGSAAERAGIVKGDIIYGIEGTKITTIEEFNKVKEQYKAGDVIKVSIFRESDPTNYKEFQVTLDEVLNKDSSSAANTYRDYVFGDLPF